MVAAITITIAISALIGVMLYASFHIGSGIYVRTLCRARTTRRAIALTFDDGPHPERTPRVLDALRKHGAHATFFVTGKNAAAHPDIVRRIMAEGHTIGNHTYSHPANFPWLGQSKMKHDIDRCDTALEKITGHRPTLFRPPFGITNPPLARALGGRYTVAGWDIRSLDTIARRPRQRVFERVRRRLRPGAVVLLHDDRAGSDTLTEMILTHLEHTGYTVERFDKLFGL